MTSLEIGLLSATIGGACGIFSQIISKSLQDQADNKKAIRNIISEERRLAYLIRQNSHSLYANDFNCTYFNQQRDILRGTADEEKIFNLVREAHLNHDKLFDKHADLIGEYLKNINEFTLLCNCSEKLDTLLQKIISEKYLDRIELQKHDNMKDLTKEYDAKHPTLREKAIEYGKMFDEIGIIIRGIGIDYEID